MNIVTIALPNGFEDPNVDPATAPVWEDAAGNAYLIASGILEGEYETSDPILAEPDRENVVVGMDGLSALAAMGLTLYG